MSQMMGDLEVAAWPVQGCDLNLTDRNIEELHAKLQELPQLKIM